MATQINWHIANLEHNTANGFVTTAHWAANAVDGDIKLHAYSTCSWQDGTPAIPYADLTESVVLDWCFSNGVDKKAIEDALVLEVEARKNPVKATGLPWVK